MSKTKKWILIGIIIIAVIILGNIISPLINLYVDWLWFKSLHYEKVFTTMLFSKISLGIIAGLVFFIIIYLNLWLARKLCPSNYAYVAESFGNNFYDISDNFFSAFKQFLGVFIFIFTIIISISVGRGAIHHWESYQLFTHPATFGITDPIFHKDLSFYVFSFPFIKYIYSWLFVVLIATTVLTYLMYCVQQAAYIRPGYEKPLEFYLHPKAKVHILLLVALMFVLKCFGRILQGYDLLFKNHTIFTGVSYTDHHVVIPCLYIMIGVAIICAILILLNIKSKKYYLFAGALCFAIVMNYVLLGIIPSLYEKFIVTPNQLEKEKPYIEYAIKFTNDAFGLNNIKIKDFAAENTLTAEDIKNNKTTIENIRLWDAAQLQNSYSQVQTIQQYYSFKDIDVDRYWIKDKNGEKKYRQVWLSARELDTDASKTWVNTRLQYTHGYGYVMSPVNEISTQGMPKFFVYDIPPKTTTDIPIKNNGIYVGESKSHEIFVNTNTEEFDYPKGSEIVTTSYNGNDGVPIKNFFRRLLLAYKFHDINIIFSTDINNSSQILWNRNISERISTLLPFMNFDEDPYLVTSEGKLFWIIDGFTYTNLYPYSYHENIDYNNYIRNSFKIVIDAYSGEVNVYYTDTPTTDPIMHSYNKIYPGVFKDIKEMPKDLYSHIRYSETLFNKQITVYETYHQTNPQVFYNKSDMWDIAMPCYLEGHESNSESTYTSEVYLDEEKPTPRYYTTRPTLAPYYIIMKLPDKDKEEFILMDVFTRKGKQNMCSWICVGCDGDNYGKITLYNFPKDKNVYGPEQIIAKANQDDIIAPQLNLWNQEGSGVSSGKLQTIPIENSILYVLPLYLESNNAKIPELKRVICALGDRIVMENNLETALSKLISGKSLAKPQKTIKTEGESEISIPKAENSTNTNSEIKEKISSAYQNAKNAAEHGDWATYGKEINRLGELIDKL